MKKNEKITINILVFILIIMVILSLIALYYNYKRYKKNEQITTSEEILDISNISNEKLQIASADEDNLNKSELTNNNIKEPEKVNEENNNLNNKVNLKDNNENIKEDTKSNYYIKVNYKANVVTVYKKNNTGEYEAIKAMICSCGTATPISGVYKTVNKYTWRPLIGGVYGQYATRIVGSILFHSVPYKSKSKDSLEYWEYDKLGQTASAGCVRLTVADAKWIYNNCDLGTQVEFYESSDPGPLGKPNAQKISENIQCRNWDPTDNVAENPWNQ